MHCKLMGYAADYGWPPCGGGLQHHHVWPKNWYPRNAKNKSKVKELVEETYSCVFIQDVCAVHNSATKIADNPLARAYMLQSAIDDFGLEYVSGAVDEILACYKTQHPEWRLAALLQPAHSLRA